MKKREKTCKDCKKFKYIKPSKRLVFCSDAGWVSLNWAEECEDFKDRRTK